MTLDITAYNKKIWDEQVTKGNRWTVPVSAAEIAAAKRGQWGILLTETKPTPRDWFPPLENCRVLCLASGGGQQGPILAAVGARVTVFDNSPQQLAQDRQVAEREGLEITTVEGVMSDLSAFEDESFDLIFHPVSNVFAPEVVPVWQEAYRVLCAGGILLAGFMNPAIYLFDYDEMETSEEIVVRYALPYADSTSLPPEKVEQFIAEGRAMEFSHSLTGQIGGQLQAGFVITAMYEDYQPESKLAKYMPSYIATRAVKL